MKSLIHKNHVTDSLLRSYSEVENLSPCSWMNAFNETSPWLNIAEDDTCFYIHVFAAGFSKEDFKVSVEQNVIIISVAKQSANAERYNSFTRSFHLPGNIQQQLISAVYKNEMLMLNLPKLVSVIKKDVPIE